MINEIDYYQNMVFLLSPKLLEPSLSLSRLLGSGTNGFGFVGFELDRSICGVLWVLF